MLSKSEVERYSEGRYTCKGLITCRKAQDEMMGRMFYLSHWWIEWGMGVQDWGCGDVWVGTGDARQSQRRNIQWGPTQIRAGLGELVVSPRPGVSTLYRLSTMFYLCSLLL